MKANGEQEQDQDQEQEQDTKVPQRKSRTRTRTKREGGRIAPVRTDSFEGEGPDLTLTAK